MRIISSTIRTASLLIIIHGTGLCHGTTGTLTSPYQFVILSEDGRKVGSATLPKGSEVTITETNSGSLHIVHGALNGWANPQQVEVTTKPNPDPVTPNLTPLAPKPTTIAAPVTITGATSPVSLPAQQNPIPKITLPSANQSPAISNSATTTPFDPKTFAWDKTVITENFVFLKIPFLQQSSGGICTAAATLNAAKYLDDKINLTDSELYRIITWKSSGASLAEAAYALNVLGIQAKTIAPKSLSLNELSNTLKDSLRHNKPVIIASKTHAVIMTGYNNETHQFFIWNQQENGKVSHGNMPEGQSCYDEAGVQNIFNAIILINPEGHDEMAKSTAYQAEPEIASLISSSTTAIEKHPLLNIPEDKIEFYQRFAGIGRIKVCIRKGEQILVPLSNSSGKNSSLITVSPIPKEKEDGIITATILPNGTTTNTTLSNISSLVTKNKGTFYSLKAEDNPAK